MVKNRNVCNSVVLASASAALCFIAVALVGHGNGVHASVEDVMAGLSPSDLNNLLLNLEDYPMPDYALNNQAPEYDNDYMGEADDEYILDGPPPPLEDLKQVEQRADVTRADVPKHAGVASQQKAAHTSASAAVSAVLPAYCDPPNPCPIGYTAADGCIESFENTSEFSRRYQSTQNCICDTEHMFNCPSQPSADVGEVKPSFKDAIVDENEEGFLADIDNPYLTGEKLTVAAKKGVGY